MIVKIINLVLSIVMLSYFFNWYDEKKGIERNIWMAITLVFAILNLYFVVGN